MVKKLKFRVLITGGCGFIGSYLVRRLVNLGYDVVILDNLARGNMITNLRDIANNVRLVKGDIREYEIVLKASKDVDVVFHLAALTDIQESVEKPRLYHEVNSTGTLNLLQASVENKVEKFVYTSSCAVYGNPIKLPISEEHPTNPLSPYAASKLSAENYCKAYSNSYGLKVLILRLFNVYGPRQTKSYAGVISEFIKRVMDGKPPVIFGDGEQTRDFIYVEDVAEYLVKALNYESENGFEVFNIGTGKPVTINQLAGLILKIVGKENLKPRKGEIKHSVADIVKAVNHLNYAPQYMLEEGLRRTLNQS